MAKRDVIVIGASAGGVRTLQALVKGFPADLPATIFIVLHVAPHSKGHLPEILNRAGKLPAVHAKNNEPFEKGHIYVAPADRHLILQRDKMIVEAGPRENFNRPSIDPLFRSAARAYGPRVIGIVLSGFLDDGTAGLREIQLAGGVTIVQDPEDALNPDMPRNALKSVNVDHVLPVTEISSLLEELIREDVAEQGIIEKESDEPGSPSVYSCPDCGGVLWELEDPVLVRFKCRVGHAFSSDSLSARQAEDVEKALWTALTSLEESAGFARRLAVRSFESGDRGTAKRYEDRMKQAEENASLIRKVLFEKGTVAQPEQDEEEVKSS